MTKPDTPQPAAGFLALHIHAEHFSQQKELINEEILKGNAKFALVKVKLDVLKKINGTYGQELGDL